MTLTRARALAEVISDVLSPLCERIQVAGSVRRSRPVVNDLDFVVLLRPGQRAAFEQRATQSAAVVKSGEDILIVRLKDGTQVDFYFARPPGADLLAPVPGNWGTVLLCRTGSKEHNIYLAQQAQRAGFRWETMIGITLAVDFSGRSVIASETEEDIFRALGMDFIPPEKRER